MTEPTITITTASLPWVALSALAFHKDETVRAIVAAEVDRRNAAALAAREARRGVRR